MDADLGRAVLGEAEAGAEVGEAEELVERPVRRSAGEVAEHRRGGAGRDGATGGPLRRGLGHHRRQRRGVELLVDERPVGQVAGDADVVATGGPVDDVVIAVDRRGAALRRRLRGRCRVARQRRRQGVWGVLVVVVGGGVKADVDAGEEEAAVGGDEGVGGVDGDVAGAAEEGAVLDAEEVGVGVLADVAGRGGGRGGRRGGGGEEGEAVVLAGEAVGGVDVEVAARAEGGVVGAAEHPRLRRIGRRPPRARPPAPAALRCRHPAPLRLRRRSAPLRQMRSALPAARSPPRCFGRALARRRCHPLHSGGRRALAHLLRPLSVSATRSTPPPLSPLREPRSLAAAVPLCRPCSRRRAAPDAHSPAIAATRLHSSGRRALARLFQPLMAARCRSPSMAKIRTKRGERKEERKEEKI